MTGTSILNMLFGAALVALGVLAAALADRIRSARFGRESSTTAVRETRRAPIHVVEHERAPRTEHQIRDAVFGLGKRVAEKHEARTQATAEDVIAALVAAGYKKPVAAEATWGCTAAERATVENWTRSALRRCAKGASS